MLCFGLLQLFYSTMKTATTTNDSLGFVMSSSFEKCDVILQNVRRTFFVSSPDVQNFELYGNYIDFIQHTTSMLMKSKTFRYLH